MASKPRPSLASLTPMLATKGQPPASAPLPEAGAPASADQEVKRRRAIEARVQVLVRMKQSERKALRRIALDQDTTVQALVEETLRDLLHRHGVA